MSARKTFQHTRVSSPPTSTPHPYGVKCTITQSSNMIDHYYMWKDMGNVRKKQTEKKFCKSNWSENVDASPNK